MGDDTGKKAAAEAAALLVEEGMRIGLGTGTTVAYLLPALAGRNLSIRCVATSPETEERARALGLEIEAFSVLDRLDMAIDGADQVDPEGWLVKGGGGAHTREKIVAAAADRFVVIVSAEKMVRALRAPIPVELFSFGLRATLRHLGDVRLRQSALSPDGGLIGDWHGEVGDPAALADRLSATPGVVDHGLFPPGMVETLIVGEADGATRKVKL